jgi:hypothetical protein
VETTIGKLLVNELLPEDMRDENRVLDKKGLRNVFEEIATKYPDLYSSINQTFHTLGADIATSRGNEASFSLESFRTPLAVKLIHAEMTKKIDSVLNGPGTHEEKNNKVVEIVSSYIDRVEKTNYEEGLKENNPLALQVLSGSRGNASQFRSLRGGDMLVVDHKDRPIPIPIMASLSEGLDPVQYFAGAFGARKGSISTKLSTPKSGFLGKQLSMAAHRLMVTERDCGTTNGIPVLGNDPDNTGTVLSSDYGGYKAGTVLTPKTLKEFGDNKIRVRSVITCQAEQGVCQRCAGVRERGGFPPIGDNIGIAAAQAISEPIGQGVLCLAEGTLVRMANLAIQKIELIEPGEEVLGSDYIGNTFPVKVLNKFNNGKQECVTSTYSTRYADEAVTLNSTLEHKLLWLGGKVLSIKEAILNSMDVVQSRLCCGEHDYFIYKGYESIGVKDTWDLEVDHPDHLFVLANGLIVSNSTKHSGGQAGRGPTLSGFDLINQLVQVPKTFKNAAAISTIDGRVDQIEAAPQGGQHITIAGIQHWVSPEQTINIKKGDTIEAGDVLSDGVPNPATLVEHKGIGEGRRYFAEQFRKTLEDQGFAANRRNVELMAKGLVNHVRITDVDGPADTVPDDVVEYDSIARGYKPRYGFKTLTPKTSVGLYLESPVLHYSIGTRVTPRVAKTLEEGKVSNVFAHADPPSFVPEMTRAMETLAHSDDWLVRMGGLYGVKRSVIQGVHRGMESEQHSTSFIPSLAQGTEFGKDPSKKGY